MNGSTTPFRIGLGGEEPLCWAMATKTMWRCKHCGETTDDAVDACSKCGGGRSLPVGCTICGVFVGVCFLNCLLGFLAFGWSFGGSVHLGISIVEKILSPVVLVYRAFPLELYGVGIVIGTLFISAMETFILFMMLSLYRQILKGDVQLGIRAKLLAIGVVSWAVLCIWTLPPDAVVVVLGLAVLATLLVMCSGVWSRRG